MQYVSDKYFWAGLGLGIAFFLVIWFMPFMYIVNAI
jgi:hypothetical protein